MDITIEVMLPIRGAADYSGLGNNHYPMLAVCGVHERLLTTPVVNMPRTGYVHVTGVPDDKFDKIKRVLEREWFDLGADGPVFRAKRVWAGIASRIPVNVANNLRVNRQITVTWTQFRNFLQNLQEQRDLTDADIA